MNTEKPQIVPLAALEFGLPVVLGVVIELACDLLKDVVHYFRTSIYSEVQERIWTELRDPDLWIGLAVAIALVAASTWILDGWKWAHPRRVVRISLLVVSVVLAAMVDLPGRVFKDDVLKASRAAQMGEPMSDVLSRFHYESPSLVWPHNDKGDPLDCAGDCWLRLDYDEPVFLGEETISLEFDRDQKLLRKTP